jgi:hypothetical protein
MGMGGGGGSFFKNIFVANNNSVGEPKSLI